MLVLTQGIDEVTVVTLPDGREMRVMVCDILNTKRVRIGYDAPLDVQIVRENATNKQPRKH